MIKKTYLLFLIFCFGHAEANELTQVKAQIKQAEQQQKEVEIKVVQSEKSVEKTKKDLVRAGEKVEKLGSEMSDLNRKITTLDNRRINLMALLEKNKDRIAQSTAGLIAVSINPSMEFNDMREYVLTSALLTGISDELDAEMTIARERIIELEEVIEEAALRREQLGKTVKKYDAEKSELDRLLRTRTAQNEKLKTQQSDLQRRLKELSARAKNLSELAAGVSRREVTGAKYSGRRMRAPVNGMLLRGFGDKSALGLVSDGWLIRTRGGAIVSAPADGKVEFADSFKSYGRVLIIAHKNSYYTVLTGMDSIDVVIGQEVLAGEPVGSMPSSKPEMYMELRRGSNAIDPAVMFEDPK
jgi:septal ring factor EnvC (AmiA/AmiB activator)